MKGGRLAPPLGTTDRTSASIEPINVRSAEPHRMLMAAVLQAVLDDYRGGSDRRRPAGLHSIDVTAVRKAAAYVRSTDRAWPFSFENICEALDLDAAKLRVKMLVASPDVASSLDDCRTSTEPSPRAVA